MNAMNTARLVGDARIGRGIAAEREYGVCGGKRTVQLLPHEVGAVEINRKKNSEKVINLRRLTEVKELRAEPRSNQVLRDTFVIY